VLARAEQIDLLKLAGDRIVVPSTVFDEVVAHSDEASQALELVDE